MRDVRLQWSGGVLLAGVLLAGMLVAGCSSDDGAGVRDLDGASGSGSGSGSGPGSGSGSGSSSGSGSAAAGACEPAGTPGAGARVEVDLTEWSIAPKATDAKPGKITFQARNAGKEAHELVIIKAASPSGLPTRTNGSVDEARLDRGTLIGRIGPVPRGGACGGTLSLTKGSYVFVCNLVGKDAGGSEQAHYAQGMVNVFSAA